MSPRIHLVLERTNGHDSNVEIVGDAVTDDMVAVAEDLLITLTTGERPPLKGLYELCAQAFGTTREDAKKRLIAAMYGKKGSACGLRSAIKQTDWTWPPLHNIPPRKKAASPRKKT